MPSPQLSTPPPNQPQHHRNRRHRLLDSAASACSVFLLLLLCIPNRARKKQRTTPSSDSDSNPPHRFSYSLLRRATTSFSTTLGHGGFGPVFSGSLAGNPIAVKLMDSSASLQGEREFHNELFFASMLLRSSSPSSSPSRHVVPAIGFACDPKRRRFLLVYELMHNGNLHDALLRRKSPELLRWEKRFAVAVDVARGIQYLHSCDPPVIHGDIKPSNVLLDRSFEAKIGDFGLARLKTESRVDIEVSGCESDGGSVFEEQSPSPPEVEEGVGVSKKNGKEASGNSVNEVAMLKDYVIDWIGNDLGAERPKGALVDGDGACTSGKEEKNKRNSTRKLEWWESMDEEMGGAGVLKKERRRPVREWWKQEYSEDLAKKRKKKNKKQKESDGGNVGECWVRDEALYGGDANRIKKNRSRNYSHGSVDSWFDGIGISGEIPKSGGISSTQSNRGTVFYVAPECGYNGDVSDKSDVYSYGVLLLVLVSGRRPLEVAGSPLSEFRRANLVSWARHCARNGKLLELVDQSIVSLDKDQALLCIKVALLCLLKSPARRPSMKEVVGMLSGEMEPPDLPAEHSPSRFQSKSRKEAPREILTQTQI